MSNTEILHENVPISDSQILEILKQTEDGIPVSELCREHSMSSVTFYKWRSKFGGMDASLMVRMKELERENAQLKACTQTLNCAQILFRRLLQKSGGAISTR